MTVTDSTIEMLRRDPEALLAELKAAGAEIKSRISIKCCFHDDRHASANIHEDEGGIWRFYCHTAQCAFRGDIFDVRSKATGKPLADILKEAHPMQTKTASKLSALPKAYPTIKAMTAGLNVEAVHQYTDPDTRKVDMIVVRYRSSDRKRFLQAHPVPGGFVKQAPPKPWPLYNRTRVRATDRVVWVEGEKCVHRLDKIGIVATTAPGGAENADKANYTPLAGKIVHIWPDNDASGLKYAKTAAAMMEALDPRPQLYWIDPAGLALPQGGDVVDFLDALPSKDPAQQREAVEALLASAQPLGPAEELRGLIEDTIKGRRIAIPWPWPGLGRLSRALLPGTVTIVCGDAGKGKSLMMLQAATYWHTAGYKVGIYELEDDRADHLYRVLAQTEGCAELLDDGYLRQCGQEGLAAFEKHRAILDGLGARIWTVDGGHAPSLADLGKLVEEQARRGTEIIAIDPVTMAALGRDSWLEDAAFMAQAKAAVRSTGARLILVTHPRKGHKQAVGLDELAGGASYVRASHTILWLVRLEPPRDLRVATALGAAPCTVGHYLWLGKCRNGKGGGLKIALNLDPATLRFKELGIIEKTASAISGGADEDFQVFV